MVTLANINNNVRATHPMMGGNDGRRRQESGKGFREIPPDLPQCRLVPLGVLWVVSPMENPNDTLAMTAARCSAGHHSSSATWTSGTSTQRAISVLLLQHPHVYSCRHYREDESESRPSLGNQQRSAHSRKKIGVHTSQHSTDNSWDSRSCTAATATTTGIGSST